MTNVVFNPPYNSLSRLGQTDFSSAPVPAPAVPVAVVPAPAAVAPAPASGINYDKGVVSLSPAGLIVGGVVVVGLALTVASAFSKR
jgi:hypothetical protein